jgi:hypothetical protein
LATVLLRGITGTDQECVALKSTDSLPGYDGAVPGLHSTAVLGQCSVLHLQSCAQQEWGRLAGCLVHVVHAVEGAGPGQLGSWGEAGVSLPV